MEPQLKLLWFNCQVRKTKFNFDKELEDLKI